MRQDFDALDDAELLRIAANSPEAFGEFYDRHVDMLYGYFLRRTADPSASDDLVAETFAQAYLSRRRFRDTGAPAAAWLTTIARRQFGRMLRRARVEDRARRRLGIDPASHEHGYDRVEDLEELAETLEEVSGAFAVLSPALAEAVRLRVLDQKPYAEVAEALGCSIEAARARVSRALSQLADILEERR